MSHSSEPELAFAGTPAGVESVEADAIAPTSPAIWRPFNMCRGRRQRKFYFRNALDSCERLMRTPRASISARSRGTVQLMRSARGLQATAPPRATPIRSSPERDRARPSPSRLRRRRRGKRCARNEPCPSGPRTPRRSADWSSPKASAAWPAPGPLLRGRASRKKPTGRRAAHRSQKFRGRSGGAASPR